MSSMDVADRWIARRPSSSAHIRLVCFPHAGGSASSFRQWPSWLPADIDMCPVQLPGRENRLAERPFANLSSLVTALVDVLAPLTEHPYALFGHSMGALIAFELTRTLRARGARQPLHLLVAGRLPPQAPPLTSPLHDLPDSDFLVEVKRLNGTSHEVLDNADLMRLMTPLLRADFAVCETYRYIDATPLECPISVFAGRDDSSAPPHRMLAWRQQTTAGCRFHTLTSDHFFVSREAREVVGRIAADLRDTLTLAPAAQAGSRVAESASR
jgi:surfactin synthase thioesterase subunit